MSWEKVAEHIDEAQGTHSVFLEDKTCSPVATHEVHILIGHDYCPTCGHVKPKTNTDELDPKAIISAEIAALTTRTANVKAYGRKHNVRPKKS